MTATILIPIPRHSLVTMWPHLAPHLWRAIEESEGWRREDVVREVTSGELLIWALIRDIEVRGAVATSIEGRTATIELLGGDGWPEWATEIDRIVEWAKLAGCRRLSVRGRKGWGRALSKFGFRSEGDEVVRTI